MRKIIIGQMMLFLFVAFSVGCEGDEQLADEGANEDGAGRGVNVEPYTSPGGPVGQCEQSTANISVPWISQKLSSLPSWSGNMCCGPTTVTMAKGFAEGRQPTETDLIGTIDWMDTNLPGWSKNGYLCQGTDSDKMVTTIQSYLGLQVQAISTDWCSLLDFLDGNHVIIFHGDTQGGNNSSTFLPGKSHWLILERVEGDMAYVDDPGRSYAPQGNSKAFTAASVRSRFEVRGGLALIVRTESNPVCDTCASLGKACGTWSDGCGGTLSCGTCSSGYSCDVNGQCIQDQPDCPAICDWRECDTYSGCNCGSCAYPDFCSGYQCNAPYIEATPSSGWTPSFTFDGNCTCSSTDTDCGSLYLGRVDSINGNTVQMSFQKTDNLGAPSVNVSYWIVVGEQFPDCQDIPYYVTRTQGTWSSSQSVLTVPGINIWPDQASFEAAPCGEAKGLFIITGGQGHTNERIWFERQAVWFTKMCN